jgi:hypothetical protein
VSPLTPEDRARGRATAAANRRRAARPPIDGDPQSLEEVRRLASWAAYQLATGRIEATVGRGVAQLCGQLTKIFLADQAAKIAALERIVRQLQEADAERARATR